MFYLNYMTNVGVIRHHTCISYKVFQFRVPVKCAGVGVGVENFSKNIHVRCGSVRREKLLCAECAGVPEFAAHKYSASYLHQSFCSLCQFVLLRVLQAGFQIIFKFSRKFLGHRYHFLTGTHNKQWQNIFIVELGQFDFQTCQKLSQLINIFFLADGDGYSNSKISPDRAKKSAGALRHILP